MNNRHVVSGAAVFAVILGFAVAAAAGPAASRKQGVDNAMQPILGNYVAIQEALAADSTAGVKEAAEEIVSYAGAVETQSGTGDYAKHTRKLVAKIAAGASAVAKAEGLAAVREAFKLLSQSVAEWAGKSRPQGMVVMFCRMAGAKWLQRQGDTHNPYLGEEMLGCGEAVETGDAASRGGDTVDMQDDKGGAQHDMRDMQHERDDMRHDDGEMHHKHGD